MTKELRTGCFTFIYLLVHMAIAMILELAPKQIFLYLLLTSFGVAILKCTHDFMFESEQA